MKLRSLAWAFGTALLVGCSLLNPTTGLTGGLDPAEGGPEADASAEGGSADGGVDAEAATDAASAEPHLFVFGGTATGSTADALDEVWYAAIATDGSLGEWLAGPKLPGARLYAPAVVGDGFVALVSGQNATGNVADVLIAPIAGGLLTAWVTVTGANAPQRIRHGAVLRGGRIYVVGGTDYNGSRLDIVSATVSLGGVGTWEQRGVLPIARNKAAVTAGADALYVIGGTNAAEQSLSEVSRAVFAGDGTVGVFADDDALPIPRQHPRAIVVGQSLLVTGGSTSTDAFGFDVAAGSGVVSGRVAVAALPSGRHLHTLTAYGRHVWVTGGAVSGGTSADVFVADVDANGRLQGSWRPTRSLPTPRGYHSAAAF